jgi:TonB-dependent SusC/RagA subfamily outer membrane receptor
MRWATFFIIVSIIQVSAAGFAQRVTLKKQTTTLKAVFRSIHDQTGYDFLYNRDVLDKKQKITVHFDNEQLENVLQSCLDGSGLDYQILDRTVVISQKESSVLSRIIDRINAFPVSGRVVDENGQPLKGATVTLKGKYLQTTLTDQDGKFSIKEVVESSVLNVSYVGYLTYEIHLKEEQGPITVQMAVAQTVMKDVVVTGTGINRKKDSFTGATATFTGDELKMTGNSNLLNSLKTLDPSFIIIENNNQGSNPNAVANIQLRGKTSVTTTDVNSQFNADPNQPLFVLDGFETTLEIVKNLDMNRVASVTILKDAASTVMYGSKAANGVVVIETRRPVAGKLQVNYTADLRYEAPDLSSYHMMNGSEKLQFEQLTGVYTATDANKQYELDQLYNARLAQVATGVNTNWMEVPVQNAFSNSHFVQVSGGSNELLFTAGISLRDQGGVMKGSGRRTYGGNMDVNYRKGRMNILNSLNINAFKAEESNYGSFADYVNINPYYRPVLADGSYPKFLDDTFNQVYEFNGRTLPVERVGNPLYDASFAGLNFSKNLEFRDNLRLVWDVVPSFRIQGNVQINQGVTTAVNFIPPERTMYDLNALLLAGTGIDYVVVRGQYNNIRRDQDDYNGNLVLTYAKNINNQHQLNANLRSEVRHSATRLFGTTAVGYPNGTNGNPAFAFSYLPDSRPDASSPGARWFSVCSPCSLIAAAPVTRAVFTADSSA